MNDKNDDHYNWDDSYAVNVSLGLNDKTYNFLNSIVEKIVNTIHGKNEEIYDKINNVKKARDSQKDSIDSVNINQDEYSRGLYNGLELAIAILEDKNPNFISLFAKHDHKKNKSL